MPTDPTAGLRDEEDRLVAVARDGDRSAFEELVRRTYVDTYTLAVRLTGNEEDARDVVQEAYLRAWKGIRRFRGEARFSTWMYRITANAGYTLVQKRRRRRSESLEAVEEPVEDSLEAQPERAAEATIAMEALSRAVQALPPKLRAVVVLKDVYGLPHEAIADELGISVAAAKVRLHRARKRLRDDLFEDQGRSAHAV
jgi:RNA polymerase sigma-70 factor (ECF subfamily)